MGISVSSQHYSWQKQGRGTPVLDIAPAHFVNFLDNHDQIANSGRGDRIHAQTSPGVYRTLTALLLLAPNTPMLFMGQEYAAAQPFLYFADNEPELAASVLEGRINSLGQFPSLATSAMKNEMADPSDRLTFERCQLDPSERSADNATYRLHRDLLGMRRDSPFNVQEHRAVDGAVLSPDVFVLRWLTGDSSDRLLIINLGRDLTMGLLPNRCSDLRRVMSGSSTGRARILKVWVYRRF